MCLVYFHDVSNPTKLDGVGDQVLGTYVPAEVVVSQSLCDCWQLRRQVVVHEPDPQILAIGTILGE